MTRQQLVYAAVHEGFMRVRIELSKRLIADRYANIEAYVDERLFFGMVATGELVIEALNRPLRKQAVASGRARKVARKADAKPTPRNRK